MFRIFVSIVVLSFAGSGLAAQNAPAESSSRAKPSPTPQVQKPRPSRQRDAIMATGERLLFKEHDPAASVNEFKKAIKMDPWYGQGYMLLGLAHMQLGQWSDAQWAFEEATKVEPGNAKAYVGIGSALNEQHDYAAAQKALEHSLDMDPESAEAHYELARTLAATGKWAEAAPHVQRAIALNPDYAGPHALMGNIYIQNDNPQSALHEFEECLRLDPNGSLAPSVRQMIAQLKKVLAQQ
ncbi:MAG TPA: tetratricopeptide repeat protein [Candidatus Angelobacter sp.]|nr:tetratricopeptide repeat protein [Candidatus Angelobacter sp.]